MTREETKKIVSMIVKAFPRFTIVQDKEGMDLWHECLSDIPYEDARECVIESIKTKEFPPAIAEIRKAYEEMLDQRKKVETHITDYYNRARNYYPSCENYGEGIDEWKTAVGNDVGKAAKLCNLIVGKVNNASEGEQLPSFGEIVKEIKKEL